MDEMKLSEREREKPLAYDPEKDEFLYIEDVKEKEVTPPTKLDNESKRKLVIKRLMIEDDFTIDQLTPMNRSQMVEEIRRGSPRGSDIVQAEIAYLEETIKLIKTGKIR